MAAQHEHDPLCLTAALSYAARGWRVFPLMPLSKKPYKDTHGFKDATTDEAQIRRWWADMPRSNVGIAMGDGLLVIDEDSYEGGDTSGYLLPVTLTVSTPSGGKHFYFSVPCPIPIDHKGTRLGTHIDIQGDGTYVVAPPSRVGNAIYEWLDEGQRVAALPGKVLARLLPQEKPEQTAPAEQEGLSGKEAPRWRESTEEKWLAWALECGRSTGRTDDYGFQLAQQLLIAEANGEHIDVYGVLRQYASQATMDPSDPFTDADIARWLRSAEASDLVRAGEPARAQNVTPFRREAASTEWPRTHTHTQGANALQGDGQLQQEEKTTAPRFEFVRDTVIQRLPPPKWLVGGHLVEGKLALVIGDYGTGKSFLGADLGECIQFGLPWNGCEVQQGTVAYISGEGKHGMGKRITAWKQHRGIGVDEDGMWILHSKAAPQLWRAEDVRDLIAVLDTLPKPLRAVFVDTVARAMVGQKENEVESMGRVVAAGDMLIAELGCAAVMVHHTPKGGETSRGSSALPDGADTIIVCSREKKSRTITMSCPKQKDFEEFGEQTFELRVVPIDEEGTETSCILVPTATPVTPVTPVRGKKLPRSAEYVLVILGECGAIGSTWTALLRLFKERSGMAEESFRFAVHLLEELGRVKNVDGHYLLTPVTPV